MTADGMTGAPAAPAPPPLAALLRERALHWQRARRVTALLCALWFFTTVVTVFFARELATLSIFGWPLSFYLAAQGCSLIYLAIIGTYALAMRRADRRFVAAMRGAA
jgi:putative solute:sodium symporter small subunit